MTAESVRDPWTSVVCPVCNAPAGTVCRSPLGRLREVHAARRQLADDFAERAEQEQRRQGDWS